MTTELPAKKVRARKRTKQQARPDLTFPSPLEKLRRAHGLTQAELAALIDEDHSTISRIENGQLCSRDQALALVRYFGEGAITKEQILYPWEHPEYSV